MVPSLARARSGAGGACGRRRSPSENLVGTPPSNRAAVNYCRRAVSRDPEDSRFAARTSTLSPTIPLLQGQLLLRRKEGIIDFYMPNFW